MARIGILSLSDGRDYVHADVKEFIDRLTAGLATALLAGAPIQHLAAPASFTLARLTRTPGRHRVHVVRGECEQYDDASNESMMRASTYEWPHAFARRHVDANDFLARFGANRIHAVPGEHVAESRTICDLLDVDYDGSGDAA